MEKHPVTNICRLGAMFIMIVALTADAVHAANSLSNPGFEAVAADGTATSWNQFGNAAVSGTSNTLITVRSGTNSLQTGFSVATNAVGSGAYQAVTASSGQSWRLTGYLLTWKEARLAGPDGFGVGQLVFVDSGSNVLQTSESLHYGTTGAMPVNTWVPFEVDAVAPAGTASVRVYVLAVGEAPADSGDIFFDDLNLYVPTGSNTASVTTQPAVQISWPTSSPTNGTDYQIQTSPTLVFTSPPIVDVLTNSSFETNVAPWSAFNGASQQTEAFARTGTGVLQETANAGTVPVAWQTGPATPGQVWDLQGYGYNLSTKPITSPSSLALLKIVWLNNSGSTVAPVLTGDTNLIGTIDYPSNPGIVSAVEMSSASPQNVWTFMEARATCPTNATQVQTFCIFVPQGSGEAVYFDDVIAFQPVGFAGWADFGPLWLGNGQTNQVFDTVATSNKFYRVTTP